MNPGKDPNPGQRNWAIGEEFSSHAGLRCMDLFAGCGGLSIGLIKAGIQVCWANELDPDAAQTYRRSRPDTQLFEEDARTLYKRIVDGDSDLPRLGEVDLIVGGPPCQGFSGYNRYRKMGDPRNSLVEVFLDFVNVLKPPLTLIENVPGILSLQKGKVIRLLLASLEELGYQVRLGILQAGYYGLPQNRWRVFIVGSIPQLQLPSFPDPSHQFPRTTIFGATAFRKNVITPPFSGRTLFWNPKPCITVGDAISDLPSIPNGGGEEEARYTSEPQTDFQKTMRIDAQKLFDHQCNRLGPIMMERCKAVPKKPGAGWLDLPEHLRPKNLARHGDRRYDNRFGRLHYDGTFNTILSKPEPYWGRVIHPFDDRVISIRESARAQGFPDNVHFSGSLASRYRQVGNAVPPLLAFYLGLELAKAVGLSKKK